MIAALNGHAVGGGFGLSLTCDIRIAHRDAKYGANFARLGLAPGMGISYLLPRLIGLSRASELLFTRRASFYGAQAEKIGLVTSATRPRKKYWRRAMAMAAEIAACAPAAVRLTKEGIREQLAWDVRWAAHRESYAQARHSEDGGCSRRHDRPSRKAQAGFFRQIARTASEWIDHYPPDGK